MHTDEVTDVGSGDAIGKFCAFPIETESADCFGGREARRRRLFATRRKGDERIALVSIFAPVILRDGG